MTLTKNITPLEQSNVKLTLTIPKEEIYAEYQELVKDYSKKIQMPGFRKGKVPQEILERKFGNSLKGEVLGKIIEKAVGQVFEDKNLPLYERPLPYSQPKLLDLPTLDFDTNIEFSLVYDVLPKVEIGQWKGLTVEVPYAEISDDDVANELEEVRQRNAIVLDKDDNKAAEKNDVVTVDYWELGENNIPLPHGERLDFAFTLGTGENLYDFDDEIIGMKKGEIKEFTKTYPADPPDVPLAGKTIKMLLSLKELKEKKLPDLDDEFAQDVDEKYHKLDDLKNSIRQRLDKNLKIKLEKLKIIKVLEKIKENTPVTLPESMIQVELKKQWKISAENFGITSDKLVEVMASLGKNQEEIQNEWRPAMEKALHSQVIIDTLIEQENLEVSDEDIERETAVLADEIDTPLEEVKKYHEEQKNRILLQARIKEKKLFALLSAENTFKPGKKEKYLDILPNNG